MMKINSEMITRIWFSKEKLAALSAEGSAAPGGSTAAEGGAAPGGALCRVFEDENGPFLCLTKVEVREKQLYETTVDGAPVFETRQTANGEVAVITNLSRKPSGKTWQVKLSFACGADELLTGLGQHEYGVFDYQGQKEYLYQHNMIISLPFLLSDAGYGVLIEAECAMRFESEPGCFSFLLEAADEFGLAVFRGEDCADVVRQLYDYTGKTMLLPRWAYGYIQSKQHYHTAKELEEIAQRFRDEGIGLDCVVQDWLTWKSGLWGEKIPDPERYPDVPGLTGHLHGLKTKLLVSVWPNMSPGGENYREFEEAGLLLPNSNIYDAYSPEGRRLYGEQCERFWGRGGVDGWWCDSCEPFSEGDWDTEEKLPDEIRYQRVLAASACSIDETKTNSYALYHAQGVDENWRRNHPGKRTVNLSRSGFTGIGKYGVIVWSGDQCARWDVLKAQVAEGQKIAMSGISHWNLDIGAFFVKNYMSVREDGSKVKRWFWNGDYNDGVADPAYRELYIRWLQYGCFLPVCRSHGDDTPREPWQFGAPGSEEYETIKGLIRLRYHLIPYIYTAAAQTYFESVPMIRSLLMAFPGDKKAHREAGSYMFGDSFLVHPVTTPIAGGCGRTEVYLPAGCEWVELTGKPEEVFQAVFGSERKNSHESAVFGRKGEEKPVSADFSCEGEKKPVSGIVRQETDQTQKQFNFGLKHFAGGQTIICETPLGAFPLFVRAGSVIPLAAGTVCTEEQCRTADVFLIFAGADGEGEIYGDEGDGYAYEKGAYCRRRLSWNDREGRLTVTDLTGQAADGQAAQVQRKLSEEVEKARVIICR